MPNFIGKLDLSPARLGDAVYDRIAAAIVDGSLAPGERIRDLDIAESLGVSRMPVREALQRLEREGLIEMSASRFTRVTEITPEMVAASIEFARYQTAVAARMAAERMDDVARDHALALLDELRAALAAGDRVRACERYFASFMFLVDQTENPVFRSLTGEARFALERNIGQGEFAIAVDEASGALFDDLRDAIRDGEGVRAEQIILDLFDVVTPQP
ncbi:GntR family transcriptional regulator [Microbacterium oryzae]|uniref:GntR family transcriptional regulator n=1 Tax=Microbacterium oryzae TaxID=743009 RepID=UPI0025AF5AC9|nr:GntR family transcriptional regulator [Microbacterium oryzae]MDN3311553.1 GntR family transcriptional regulator [Microbacterium oryzae]